MVKTIRFISLSFVILLSCSAKELSSSKKIRVLEFHEFAENPGQYKGENIGVKGYYVGGYPELYKDKEFHDFISGSPPIDPAKFSYLNIIVLPNYDKVKIRPALAYLEGTYVIVYGRVINTRLADNEIRYGGYLKTDSIVLSSFNY